MTTLSPFFAFTRSAPAGAVLDGALNALLRAPAGRPVRAIPFEVTEEGDHYLVTAELPGVRKENIQIEIDAARVTITAETKSEPAPAEGQRVLYSERRGGKAVRSFELGNDVDASQVKARYADGVLSLTLPKKSAESRKLLTVE